MKQFNQVISIEVSVDSIANNLLSQFKEDFKHKELVTEAIIGRALAVDNGMLSTVFNALNGFDGSINFQIGDVVRPKELYAYGYWTPESIEKGSSVHAYIESAKVVDINLYSDKKLKLEYSVPQKDGKFKTETEWYSHRKCDKIPL